jgi:hypothetical protein
MDDASDNGASEQTGTTPKGARPTALDLFSKSVDALKVNLPLHLLFYFAPMIVGVVLFMIMLGSFVSTGALFGDGSGISTLETRPNEAVLGAGFVLSLVLFVAVMVAVSVVSYLANTYVGIQSAQGKKADFGVAVRSTSKHIGSLILLGLVLAVVVGLGFIALIVPGVIISIYLWPRVMILPVVMVRENLSAFDALRRVDKMVKAGGYWEIALVMFGFSFVLGIIPVLGAIAASVVGFLYSLAPTLRVLESSAGTTPVPASAPSPQV